MFERIKYLIKDGFLHIMGGSVLIKLMGFISNICVVRLVSQSAYGCLAYADNLYSYVTLVAGLGMSTALVIKCSEIDTTDTKNVSYFYYAITRGGSVQIIGAIFVLIYFFFITTDFRNAASFMLLLFLYPMFVYLTQCCSSFLRGYQQNKLYSKSAIIQSFVLAVSSIGLTVVVDAKGVIFARYIALIALIAVAYKFIKTKKGFNRNSLNKHEKQSFTKLSVALLFGNLFSDLMLSNEMLLVNSIIGNEIITANYRVATLLPIQILFVTHSLMTYFIPKLVRVKQKKTVLWSYSVKIGLMNFVIIGTICLIAIILTPWLIEFMYGSKYLSCVGISQKFWIAYGINAAIRIVPINVLATSGFEKVNMVLSVIGCIVHFIVAVVVLMNTGIDWLPLALSVAYSIVGGAAWCILYLVCNKGKMYEQK